MWSQNSDDCSPERLVLQVATRTRIDLLQHRFKLFDRNSPSIAIGFSGNALDIAQIDRGFTQLPRHAHQTLNCRQPDINRAGCQFFIDRVTTIPQHHLDRNISIECQKLRDRLWSRRATISKLTEILDRLNVLFPSTERRKLTYDLK